MLTVQLTVTTYSSSELVLELVRRLLEPGPLFADPSRNHKEFKSSTILNNNGLATCIEVFQIREGSHVKNSRKLATGPDKKMVNLRRCGETQQQNSNDYSCRS